MSGLLGTLATSGMLLPIMRETILAAAKRVHPNIIVATRDKRDTEFASMGWTWKVTAKNPAA